jgi:hypothetical protein
MREDDRRLLDAMKLPEGKTCRDCKWWFGLCSWLICSRTGDETECDWSPSKFGPIGERTER